MSFQTRTSSYVDEALFGETAVRFFDDIVHASEQQQRETPERHTQNMSIISSDCVIKRHVKIIANTLTHRSLVLRRQGCERRREDFENMDARS